MSPRLSSRRWFNWLAGLALVTLLGALATSCRAAPTPTPTSADLVFVPAKDKVPTARVQLINGKPVYIVVRDWPTVLLSPLRPRADGGFDGRICTATLVGRGVVLFAAHCLDRGANLPARQAFIKVDLQTIWMKCQFHPEYEKDQSGAAPPRRSEDFVLCHIETAARLPILVSTKFERIDVSPLKKDSRVLLMGYGCTDIDTPTEQDSTLRLGETTLSTPAVGSGAMAAYATIISRGAPEPALCQGDSGGALMTGATIAQPNLQRRVRGVNSSVEPVAEGLRSRVSMLSEPKFEGWARAWVGSFPGAYICGLSPEPSGASCRP